MTEKQLIQMGAKCELARRSFFHYCKLKAPSFYKNNREFLVNFCGELQSFMKVMMKY